MNDLDRNPVPRFPDLLLRTPPNWLVVVFLALFGGLHLAVAVPAALHGRWEGYLSFIFAALFTTAAIVAGLFRTEIALHPSRIQIRLRTGVGRWHSERFIPFEAVSAVKLTFAGANPRRAHIEIICVLEQIDCPPTPIPRQEALLLAMMLGVRLIKVENGEMQTSAIPSSPSQHVEQD